MGSQKEPGTSKDCGFSEGVLRLGEVAQGMMQSHEINGGVPLSKPVTGWLSGGTTGLQSSVLEVLQTQKSWKQ